jgi:prevent-host-death family protein
MTILYDWLLLLDISGGGIVKTIGAAKFKEQCLALLEKLAPEGLIITKHGKPVARVIPYPQTPANLIGALREKIEINGDILSTAVAWDANAKP